MGNKNKEKNTSRAIAPKQETALGGSRGKKKDAEKLKNQSLRIIILKYRTLTPVTWGPSLLKIALELDSLLLRSDRESTSGTSSEIHLFRKVIDIYKIIENNNTFLTLTDLYTMIASDTHKALGRYLCNTGHQRINISGFPGLG